MCGGQGRGRTADLLIFSRSFRISFRIRFTAWFQAAAHCRFAAPWMRRPSQQRPNEPGCGRDSMRLAYSLSARSEQPQLGRCRRPWDTYYRAGRNRCDGRPTVPEDRVPVPCRWGSVARRKVSFCRVVPATVSWIWCSSRRVNRGPRRFGGAYDGGVVVGQRPSQGYGGQPHPFEVRGHCVHQLQIRDHGQVGHGQHPSALVAVGVVEEGELDWVAPVTPALSARERATAWASRSPSCRIVPGSAHWGPSTP
jgi:hypothetical protein